MLSLVESYFPGLSKEVLKKYEEYVLQFSKWNNKLNLISKNDFQYFETRHILHSLAIAQLCPFTNESTIVDMGTGGGIPGIPLAIFFPRCKFILVDSIEKKIMAVQSIAKSLGLDNVKVINERIEEVELTCDFVVSRAVAPADQIIRLSEHLISDEKKNVLANGWLMLKGGELDGELSSIHKNYDIVPLTKLYKEEFFETKKMIFISK